MHFNANSVALGLGLELEGTEVGMHCFQTTSIAQLKALPAQAKPKLLSLMTKEVIRYH